MGAQEDAELEAAFEAGDVARMKALVAAGAIPKASLLMHAAYGGPVARLTALFELGLKPSGATLAKAASRGNIEAMEALVAAGVAVDDPASPGSQTTALHHAAGEKKLKAIEWLVARGADLERRSDSGRTPLQLAVVQKAKDAARRLVELGARVGPDDAKALSKWGIAVSAVDDSIEAPKNPDHTVMSRAALEAKLREV